jgi:hypothetical protein
MIRSRRMRGVEHVSYRGEKRNAYRVLVGKFEKWFSVESPKFSWEDYLKVDLIKANERTWDGFQVVEDSDK